MQSYLLVAGNSPADLSQQVNALLAQGWTLYGSPAVNANPGDSPYYLFQAMVRESVEQIAEFSYASLAGLFAQKT